MKILITDPISESGKNLIKDSGIEVIYKPELTHNEIKDKIHDVEGLIVRSGTKVTRGLIKAGDKLKVIGRAGVGIDNIDIVEATLRGVLVMNTPDGNTISAAEHTMAMMSSLARNIQIAHSDMMEGKWNRHALVGSELRGKILGVIGLGRIGLEVIKRAQSFDMNIMGFDPYVNKDILQGKNIILCELDELTKKSDFITLHIPLLDSTINLFDRKRLKMMKKSARIINVARGGLINEKDLSDALNNNIIAGAAVDVFKTEPLIKDNPLLKAKNILLTPHLGASTAEAKEGVSLSISQQLVDYLKEGKMGNTLNMPITDLRILKRISPYLALAEILGKIQIQLATGAVKSISMDCYGPIEQSKTISLSFIKGLLENVTEGRINFINANAVAEERGIRISHSHKTDQIPYLNLIMTQIETENEVIQIGGSVLSSYL